MNTLKIREKVAGYMEVGFTMSEAFANIKDAAKKSSKLTSTADAIANIQERSGNAKYGWNGKEYGNRKWGKGI